MIKGYFICIFSMVYSASLVACLVELESPIIQTIQLTPHQPMPAQVCAIQQMLETCEKQAVVDLLKPYLEPVDAAGNTLLHVAAQLGHTAVIEVLLEAGATTEIQNHRGKTPRQLAQDAGHVQAYRLLSLAPVREMQKNAAQSLFGFLKRWLENFEFPTWGHEHDIYANPPVVSASPKRTTGAYQAKKQRTCKRDEGRDGTDKVMQWLQDRDMRSQRIELERAQNMLDHTNLENARLCDELYELRMIQAEWSWKNIACGCMAGVGFLGVLYTVFKTTSTKKKRRSDKPLFESV